MQIITGMPVDGRRKAILIGINYEAYPEGFYLNATAKKYDPIYGSHFDVEAMKKFLITQRGWPEDAIVLMTDDPATPPHLQPTRDNILRQLSALAIEARCGDRLFLQFAGHGDQIPDQDFDEVDGLDEIIIGSDTRYITDDEIHEVLVRRIPAGCQMSVLFDCCSSGTALDLPIFPDKSVLMDSPVEYTASPRSMDSPLEPFYSPTGMVRAARNFYHPFSEEVLPPPLPESESRAPKTTGYRPEVRKKYSSGDVIMWSACRDGESAGEVVLTNDPLGRSRGAMTQAFIDSMNSNEYKDSPTYHTLLGCIRFRIQSYNLPSHQHVQLSSSSEIDPTQDYIL